MVKLLLTPTDLVTAGPDQYSAVKGLAVSEVGELDGHPSSRLSPDSTEKSFFSVHLASSHAQHSWRHSSVRREQ